MLTVVYSKPYLSDKHPLWNNLKHFLSSFAGPSLVVGDFNDILSPTEKFGGL